MNIKLSVASPSTVSTVGQDNVGSPDARSSDWTRYISTSVSVLLFGAVIFQLAQLDIGRIGQMLPSSPLFWGLFLISYSTGPIFDWLIFRRLWKLPFRGIIPLVRKSVSNQLLISYAGEAYFYGWARRNAQINAAPFGAIKDVAILSALAGNLAALILLALSWPFLGMLHFGLQGRNLFLSISAVLAISFGITLLRGKLFSLPLRDLRMIMGIHLARTAVQLSLTALLWLCLLPGTEMKWLLVLSTLRLLISRLPLLPNKDLPFAAAAALLIGRDNLLTSAVALTATIFVVTHLIVGVGLMVGELLRSAYCRRAAGHGMEAER